MNYEQSIKMIEAIGSLNLIWPIATVVLIINFKTEVRKLFTELARKMGNSSEIKIGNITITDAVKNISSDVNVLKTLVINMFTRPEIEHLRKIRDRASFLIHIDNETERGCFFTNFRNEIAHLYNTDFINFHKNSNGEDLFDENNSNARNILDFCEITQNGRMFLDLYDSYQNQTAVHNKNRIRPESSAASAQV